MIDFLKKQLFTVHQNGKQQVSEVFKFIGHWYHRYGYEHLPLNRGLKE